MVRNQKPKQMEQKPKSSNGVRCMECGNARGTMRKIKKKNGAKGYLCEYCFDAYKEDEYEHITTNATH